MCSFYSIVDKFKKLFDVLDAARVGRKGMQVMLTQEKMKEWVESFALYEVELQ